jgi:hypothetical protein
MPDYGNVPEEDVQVVQNAARIAVRLLTRLPAAAPPHWREIAYEALLEGILQDWVVNGTDEPDEEDEEDLSNLLRLAADVALLQEPSLQDIAFRALLKNVMRDWVDNWNE